MLFYVMCTDTVCLLGKKGSVSTAGNCKRCRYISMSLWSNEFRQRSASLPPANDDADQLSCTGSADRACPQSQWHDHDSTNSRVA